MFSKARLLVAIQFAMLGLLLLTGPWLAQNSLPLVIEAVGGLLGLWAIGTMRLGNFNITPDLKPNGQLIKRGPYRWIRHPMYSAILLVTLSLVLTEFSWWRLGFWLTLLVNLLIKLTYEEHLLSQRFATYTAYQKRTKRLLPLFY
jgi:protein-S-isoprenylcysteine O-methyltransferase Ste14